jgi:hypothetical protein
VGTGAGRMRYSVDEIDQMRLYVMKLMNVNLLFLSGANHEQAIRADIEGRLRTYMMNGTTIEELIEAVEKKK